MAETLDYKVNIDSTNVADQLSMIKNQVDQAMATFSFRSSIPDPQPTMFNATGPSFSQSVGAAMNNAQTDAINFMDSTRLGFHKFMVDAQTLALQTPLGTIPPQLNPGQQMYPQFSGSAVGGAFKSLTAAGYDTRMSMSPADYSRLAMESSSRNLPDTVGNALNVTSIGSTAVAIGAGIMSRTALAATAGVIAAPLGIAALSYDAYMATMGHDVQPTLNMQAFARDTSWRNLSGRFVGSDATNIGLSASRMHRSDIMMGDRTGVGDVERIMQETTMAGGFDFARTATEYTDKLKTKVESVKKVMHLLHQTETEAIQTMTQWDKMGIGTTGQTIDTALALTSKAFAAGYTPNEMAQFATQSAEMTRGTGVSLQAMYLGSMSALADIRGLAKSGGLSPELVQQLGGFETIAGTVIRKGVQFGLSDSGLNYFAAKDYYGGDMKKLVDPYSMYQGAMARLDSIDAIMEARGGLPDRIKEQPPEELFNIQSMRYLQEYQFKYGNQGIPLTRNKFRAFMEQQGEDGITADLRLNMVAGVINSPVSGLREEMNENARQRYGARTFMDYALDKTGRAFSNALGTEDVAIGWSNINRGWEKSMYNLDTWANRTFMGKERESVYTIDPGTFDKSNVARAMNVSNANDSAALVASVRSIIGSGTNVNVSQSLIDGIIGAESSGDTTAVPRYKDGSKRSSAQGLGQFIDSTWMTNIAEAAPELIAGKSRAEILAMKTDPLIGRRVLEHFTAKNIKSLQDRGIEVTPANVYMSHHYGDAARVLNNLDKPGEFIFNPDELKANDYLVGKTGQQILDWAKHRMRNVVMGDAAPATDGAMDQTGKIQASLISASELLTSSKKETTNYNLLAATLFKAEGLKLLDANDSTPLTTVFGQEALNTYGDLFVGNKLETAGDLKKFLSSKVSDKAFTEKVKKQRFSNVGVPAQEGTSEDNLNAALGAATSWLSGYKISYSGDVTMSSLLNPGGWKQPDLNARMLFPESAGESSGQAMLKWMGLSRDERISSLKTSLQNIGDWRKLSEADLTTKATDMEDKIMKSAVVQEKAAKANDLAFTEKIRKSPADARLAYGIFHPESQGKMVSDETIAKFQQGIEKEANEQSSERLKVAYEKTGTLIVNSGSGTVFGPGEGALTKTTRDALQKIGFSDQMRAASGDFFKEFMKNDGKTGDKIDKSKTAEGALQYSAAVAANTTAENTTKLVEYFYNNRVDPRKRAGT